MLLVKETLPLPLVQNLLPGLVNPVVSAPVLPVSQMQFAQRQPLHPICKHLSVPALWGLET